MTDFTFLSVAFGARYVEQQIRLHESIANIYPNEPHICWTDCMPPGAKPHAESLYGFKPHAAQHALDLGFKKIIWLDPACILVDKVDYYFELGIPVMAVKDDNKLKNYIGDRAKFWYSIGGGYISDNYHLVGGSIYVFDFNHKDTQKIFDSWYNAEQHGIFGSQKEQASGQINKHRNDESCMAMALYTNGYDPTAYDVARYDKVPNPIVIKKHFK